MKTSDTLKRSEMKEWAVRARFGSFWKYAGKRYVMEQLGSGSMQSSTWTYKRSAARRFTTRAQAGSWVQYYGRWLHQVEVIRVGIGPLRDLSDEVWTQRRLFD